MGSSASLYDWQPQNVLVRDWAPFGSRPSAKIDRIEYKKLSEELLPLLPNCLRNQDCGARSFLLAVDQCLEIRDVLSAGTEHHGMLVRGHAVRVSVELSLRKKVMLSNMFRAEQSTTRCAQGVTRS